MSCYDNDTASELSLIGSSISSVLEGLDHLEPADSGPVICEFLTLFRDCLSHIVLGHTSGNDLARSSHNDGTKAHASLQIPIDSNHDEKSGGDPVGRFLVILLSSLECRKEVHQDIFDGCMYFLLSETGRHLNTFVFEDVVYRNQSQDQRAATQSDTAITNKSHSPLTPSAAANLVWVLERAMALSGEAVSILGLTNSINLPTNQRCPTKRKTRFSDIPRRRIQETLLQPLFKDHHANFANIFKEPDLSRLLIDEPPPTISPDDVRNWFKQEIWRIVGWETMCEKIAWQD